MKSDKPKFDSEFKARIKSLSFDEQRAVIGFFLKSGSGSQLWDLLTGLRGPDSPSERPNMSHEEQAAAYKGRRARKYNTVEIIREAAFFGVVGGAARYHEDTKVTVPPSKEWDHFDKHVARAAQTIGLGVEYGPGVDPPKGDY